MRTNATNAIMFGKNETNKNQECALNANQSNGTTEIN